MNPKKCVTLMVIFICLCMSSNHAIVKATENKSFKKLVILPLENLGKKTKDTDSIGKEIALSLTQSLAQIRELSVIDPHTVRTYFMQKLAFVQFTGTGDEESIKKDLDKFEKLDVDLVLSGTYRIIGKEIKVIIQLIDVTSGEVKITPISMKDKYPDNLFSLEENIAEKTAYSISTMFESYYRDFASFYKFTTNREAYKLYLMGIDAKSNQSIQSYAEAMKYLYESCQLDNSFILPLTELASIKNLIFRNILKAAHILNVGFANDDLMKKSFNSAMNFTNKDGIVARVIFSATEINTKFKINRPDEYKNIYLNYSTSPYFNKTKDVKSDLENFPNDIETLFMAWETIDNFNPDSGYRKRIMAIDPQFLPLLVVDFFEDIKQQQDAEKKQRDEHFDTNNDTDKEILKKINKSVKKYDATLIIIKNKIEAFNKKNPKAKYTTIYFNLFSQIYFDYSVHNLALKQAFGIDVDFQKDKILKYCMSYYDDYISIMNKEFNKIRVK